jgi:hypothetical protein
MEATSGMNSLFEGPAPYTFPKFQADGSGNLQTIEPTIHTLAELRAALADTCRRTALIDEMRRQDAYYASFLFERNLLDDSALVRMVRRAIAHRHDRAVESGSHNAAGYRADSLPVRSLRLLVKKFANSVRRDGKLPIVLLLHARGYSDHLYRALAELIAADDIPYVSTHEICPANDATNYVGDGHFTEAANRRIARALADLLAARLPWNGKPPKAVLAGK